MTRLLEDTKIIKHMLKYINAINKLELYENEELLNKRIKESQ